MLLDLSSDTHILAFTYVGLSCVIFLHAAVLVFSTTVLAVMLGNLKRLFVRMGLVVLALVFGALLALDLYLIFGYYVTPFELFGKYVIRLV